MVSTIEKQSDVALDDWREAVAYRRANPGVLQAQEYEDRARERYARLDDVMRQDNNLPPVCYPRAHSPRKYAGQAIKEPSQ